MRRGALLVGRRTGSVGSDLKRVPRLIAGFVACGPVTLYRELARFLTPAGPEIPAPEYEA